MLRRTETRTGARGYPRFIEWVGDYHAVDVTIRIIVPARRRFEWTAEIEAVPQFNPRREMLENVETSELSALRRALVRVELAYRLRLGERSAIHIGLRRDDQRGAKLHARMKALRDAKAERERARITAIQPSLAGIE